MRRLWSSHGGWRQSDITECGRYRIRSSRVHACCTLDDSSGCDAPTADRAKEEFFFDANPRAFESVMDVYRRGILECPPGMDVEVFAAELDFWQIRSGDSVHNMLDVDSKLLHEATLANTQKYEAQLAQEPALQPATGTAQANVRRRANRRRPKRKHQHHLQSTYLLRHCRC